MSEIKVVYIDPIAKKVTITLLPIEGEINSSSILKAMYNIMHVSLVATVAYLNDGDVIMADDEGLLKHYKNENGEELEFIPGWYCKNWYPGPIAGKSIIVGTDKKGNTVSVSEQGIKEFYYQAKQRNLRWVNIDGVAQTFTVV